ncbi:hypothetical protein AB0M46_15295 [Dactylosporangium sp. NPDC051485]|uniref:hypothetical protein n=1 Tax=Dactylosporangium sp. NPDC051485 TaxID=3154846 RepID=UPI00343F5D01
MTAIQALLATLVIRGLVWLLSSVGAPQTVCAPLSVAASTAGFLAVATAAVSGAVLFAIGRRWSGVAGIDVSGQMEFTLMVLDDLRHPLTWPSRRYERW